MEVITTTVYLNNYTSTKKININRWWTRSGKTYNLLLLFFVWLLTWKVDKKKKFEKWTLTVVRKFASTLKGTVVRDFEDIIDLHWVRGLIEINKSDKTYKYWNRIVEFIWADDQQKLRWSKRDILYCNEANELNYRQEFFQLLIRTKYKIFIDFNPDDEKVWINTELEQKRRIQERDVRVVISTYKDNPYLSEWEIKEIERLKDTDPMYRQIYWKWQYWKIQWLVFEHKIIKEVPKDAKFLWYWKDFWYTNDPTTLTGVYLYNNELILDEVLYKRGLTNTYKEKKDKEKSIVWQYELLWISKTDDIIADSAEPKSIDEIHREWYNIKPAEKWPDSIVFGIDIMKQYVINITERSINVISEFKHYKWAEDKNWKALNKPIDAFNHSIDWVRYLCIEKLKKPKNKKKFFLTTA